MQYKTPGVYIPEPTAGETSVVPVPTAVPAFLGYTEKAVATGELVRAASMADYEAQFGGPPPLAFTYADLADLSNGGYVLQYPHRFVLHASLQLYFANGGVPCFVMSVGSYVATPHVSDFAAALAELEQVQDVTLVVAPDVASLGADVASAYPAQALAHCAKLQNRFAILDVPRGDAPRGTGAQDQIAAFRASVGSDGLSYGAAYYPWLNTTVLGGVDFRAITPESLPAFQARLQRDVDTLCAGQPAMAVQLQVLTQIIASLSHDMPAVQATAADQQLVASLAIYRQVMQDIQARVNLLPPSGAMAGVYCTVDSTRGVFVSPANIVPLGVASPAVRLSDTDQEDLNTPPDGKAVNAIRTFQGYGTRVWGARTLDGNADDLRYISVRRTLIMLEQSIKAAVQTYSFAPNDNQTWFAVTRVISAFLTAQWKDGVLQGAKPSAAFSVSVGLGTTMTSEDILNGTMRVSVQIALVRPAEFIVLTFAQQMVRS
ncbi:hypothetical protein PI87_08850 [Ralstonia sp. A12]|uniref:phage tail sheath family protein n=1 Tax=Ralstonia sp. A12 TaxID=1217052 RepID=UPI0005733EE7|nr:phage tail sheath C-terminal domain-containing protein [Ralstonia sp. A12]KHK57318.1 hypothetical protein PI87_08850 [Ralstonia sp. A12]